VHVEAGMVDTREGILATRFLNCLTEIELTEMEEPEIELAEMEEPEIELAEMEEPEIELAEREEPEIEA
jgi:hypothetical protein